MDRHLRDTLTEDMQAPSPDDASESTWKDIYWQYCKDDDNAPEIEGVVSTETTWKELTCLDSRREQAARMMEERTPEMDPSEKGE